jgi:hypothetical protein
VAEVESVSAGHVTWLGGRPHFRPLLWQKRLTFALSEHCRMGMYDLLISYMIPYGIRTSTHLSLLYPHARHTTCDALTH